jgi:hypothetical protein
MFVPSLSWQNDHFIVKMDKRYRFSYLGQVLRLIGVLTEVEQAACDKCRFPPQLFLCLARAYLGKMIGFIFKMLSKKVFSPTHFEDVILFRPYHPEHGLPAYAAPRVHNLATHFETVHAFGARAVGFKAVLPLQPVRCDKTPVEQVLSSETERLWDAARTRVSVAGRCYQQAEAAVGLLPDVRVVEETAVHLGNVGTVGADV